MTCKQSNCPLRIKCGVANGEVKGKTTVFSGYVNNPLIPENKRCNFFVKLKEVKK